MSSVLHFLNYDHIREDLQNLYNSLDHAKTKWKQLRTYADREQVQLATVVRQSGIPEMNRLCYQSLNSTSPVEEVVLDIQGILINHNLPPYNKKNELPSNAFFAQQNVVLSGFGTSGFLQYEQAISFIDRKFQMSVKEGLYDPYKPNYVDHYFTIEASNQFFHRRNRIAQAMPLTFSAEVDPKGILTKAAGQGLVHLEDNSVQYFSKQHMIIGEEKICRFEITNPSIFRPGQLVEVQVSFTIRQVRGRFKMFIVLRSIAMLSDEHLCNAELASLREVKQPERSLKRRIGYDEEEEKEVVETRQSMARMVISDLATKCSS
ncbi:hypothetical protein BD410DRAFT_847026 [Rickenella mellea]|uniref:Uncharacterized protein n=1 Tax=Rickenella mellea TaxID=50990 RepID=A0A4Y7PDM4_9AGAM|nr:hypothetical protein BD410DRAFT_847026 [Rickenella mellea]